MIFVTVGTDLPFDRLVRAVDSWAFARNRTDVFAQIGNTSLRPRKIEYCQFLEPKEFRARFAQSSAIVAHAGMGTILSALQWGKPLIVLPRKASLKEHRNEHQLATANHLARRGQVEVAADEDELREKLDQLSTISAKNRIEPSANPELIETIRQFIGRS